MEAASHLRVIDGNGEIRPASDLDHRIRDLEDRCEGYRLTCEKQAREIGVLSRKLAVEEDPDSASNADARKLVERWKKATNHPRSKVSMDRIKLIRARLRDGYTAEQLELAIDGIAAFPYVGTGGQRFHEGKPTQRHDRLGIALGGGEAVEKFAVLGHQARKAGLVTWIDNEEEK